MNAKSLTVQELIDYLGDFPPETEVRFAYTYPDHWRTKVAVTVNNVEEGCVVHSAYHRMDKVVEDETGDDLDVLGVVILS